MAINTTNATMQMRRGNEADFDPDKMSPGEWSVSLDKKYVRMCFSPGLCIRMATYEGFEEDMKEIQDILEECQDIQVAVQKFVELSEEYSKEAESWAHGQTGIREGEDTDNSKYYSEQAKLAEEAAEEARDQAQAATGIVIATTERVGVVKPDGTTITIDPDGTIHASGGVDVDIATTEKAGIVKPDGVSTKVKPDGTLSVPGGKPDFYGAFADFPVVGDPDILYIDNTVDPRLMYTWDQETSSYIPTGGAGKEQVYFGAFSDFPTTGNSEMLYVDTSNTAVLVMYRWNGTAYVPSGGGAADLDVVAKPFDPEKPYTEGEYAIEAGELYRFKSDKAAGAWDASVVTPTTVGVELSALNAKLPIIKSGKAKVSFTNGLGTLVHNFPEDGYQIILSSAGYVSVSPSAQDRPANQIPVRIYMANAISATSTVTSNLTKTNVEVEYLIIKS